MGVQGELGLHLTWAEYCTVHGGLKSLSEELVALEGTVLDRFDALNIGFGPKCRGQDLDGTNTGHGGR